MLRQKPHTAAAAALLCHTHKVGVQPIGRRLNQRPRDFDLRLNSHTQPLSAV